MTHRLTDIVDALPKTMTAEGLRRLLYKVRRSYELDHVIYYALSLGGDRADEEMGFMTYHPEWHQRYEDEGYRFVDPTVAAMLGGFAPVDWGTLDWSGRQLKKFMGEADEFGVGNNGYSIPLHGPMGQFAMFNVSKKCTEDSWDKLISEIAQELLLIAHSIHTHAMSIAGIKLDLPRKRLSPREKDVLTMISQGKRRAQISDALGISENTLRVYLDSARHKLGSLNTFHSVAMGVKLGIIKI